jgi:hypothetical protein
MSKKVITLTDIELYIKENTELWEFYNLLRDNLFIYSSDTLSEEFQILSELDFTIFKYVEEKINE